MTALEKELRLEVGPFADNGVFLVARHEETMAALRVAGLRREVEMREGRWNLEGHRRDDEDSIPQEELGRHLDLAERELLRQRAVNEARLAASEEVDIPFRELVERCGLDAFDQQVLWLLLFKAVSPDFREQYDRLELARFSGDSRDTLCIGNALQILCPGGILSDLDRRRHFATGAPLLRHHLVRLQNGIALIDECEQICGVNSGELPEVLVELERTDGIVIMATNQPQELAPQLDRRFALKIPFELPDVGARRRIWELHLNGAEVAGDVNLGVLASDYRLAGGYIKNAAFFAINLAASGAEEGAPVVHQAQLEEAAQMQEHHVGGGAETRRRYQPRRGLGDLLVNESTRAELERCVRAIEGYEEQRRAWGLAGDEGEAGVRLLFHGTEFGTALQGAEAVAGELGCQVEYFRLSDLAYPDEAKDGRIWTPRQALLAATQVRQVVMIADEGGWLGNPPEEGTGKIREAMELVRELPGCVIVVSNCRAPRQARALCLFHRELGFGPPDEACRREAWGSALAGVEGVGPDQAEALAREHELSMEELRLAVARAAFEAAASGNTPAEALAQVVTGLRTRDGALFGRG